MTADPADAGETDAAHAAPKGQGRREAASSQYDCNKAGRRTQDCPSTKRNDLGRGCATLRKALSAIAPCQWIKTFAGGIDDAVKRIASLKINAEDHHLANSTYFGLTALAKASYAELGMKLSHNKGANDRLGDAGDPYTSSDCPPPAADDLRSGSASLHKIEPAIAAKQWFNRSVDLRWSKTSGGALLDEWLYGYDRASQRTWKSNYAATAGDDQDDFYNYDGLYQVTKAARGELNLNHTAIGAIPAKEEAFSYDPSGNWTQYVEKSDGTVDLDQSRKNNKDSRADWREARQMPRQRHPKGVGAGRWRPRQHSQLTQFDGSSDNVAYDKAGNATSMKPDKTGDWSKHYQLKWDAWNRLVEVKDSADAVVAPYAYDGLTRRITKTIGAVVTHFYYNDQWSRDDWREPRQIAAQRQPVGCCRREAVMASTLPVEERVDSSTDAERQYAWGIQFRNDLILRDRDTTGNGMLDERLYATHDALGNCTAILNTSGAVQERYGYSAFGIRRIMQADFSARASSSFAWDFAFHGEFLDGETGYVNYGYRIYSPLLGRWLSRDPIESITGERAEILPEGANLYMMVGNNGINQMDRYGLAAPIVPVAVVATIVVVGLVAEVGVEIAACCMMENGTKIFVQTPLTRLGTMTSALLNTIGQFSCPENTIPIFGMVIEKDLMGFCESHYELRCMGSGSGPPLA